MLLNPLTSTAKRRSGIPVLPGAFPVVGHLPAFFSAAGELLREGHRKMGPLFWLHMGPGLGWHPTCCGAEGFELLKNKGLTNAHLAETMPQFISNRGLMALDGTAHQRLRGLMNGAFSPRGMAQNGAPRLFELIFSAMIDRWAASGKVRVLADTQRAALDAIFQMLDVPSTELPEWQKQYRYFAWSVLPLPILDHLLVKPATTWLSRKLHTLAAAGQQRTDGRSILFAMAQATDELGNRLSVDELVDNMRLLSFAGHETSASTMAWMVIELARSPKLWDRLVEEVKQRPGALQSPQEIKALPYAEAFFRETVRLHPPVPIFSRRTLQPIPFAGQQLPAGEMVYIPVIDFCLDSSLYAEPTQFIPDRWLGRATPPSPIEMAMFGGGIHFCLGYHFAMLGGVQFLTLLATQLSQRGLRPSLPAGVTPATHHLPLSHPAPATVVEFAARS